MAITAANLAFGSAATVTSTATASISPTANALVIVSVASRNATGSGPATVPTVTGASGTWVQITTLSDGSSGARTVTLFRDLSASPGSGALTIDFAGVSQGSVAWSIDQFQGTDTSGTHGSGAIVQSAGVNPATGTTTGQTITLSALGAPNNAAYGYIRNSGAAAIAGGSGFTDLSGGATSGGVLDSEWAISNPAVAWTWGSQSVTSVALAIEIKAAASSGIIAYNLTNGFTSVATLTSVATASIAPAANALTIVSVGSGKSPATSNIPTVTGAGGTWVQIATAVVAANTYRTTLFRDLSASPGSGILTIDFAGQVQDHGIDWSVDSFTNVDTSGTNGSGAVVQSTTGSVTSGTSTGITLTLSALGSANNVAMGYVQNNNTSVIVDGSGFTPLANITGNSHGLRGNAEHLTNTTSVAWTWTSQNAVSSAVAIEIKAAVAIPFLASLGPIRFNMVGYLDASCFSEFSLNPNLFPPSAPTTVNPFVNSWNLRVIQ